MSPELQDRAPGVRLRRACAEMESRIAAGEDYRSEHIFASDPELARDVDAALEVIYTEFVAREHLGQRPSRADIFARFPQFRTPLEQLFEVHGAVGAPRETVSVDAGPDSTPLGELSRFGEKVVPIRRAGNYELLEEIGRGGMGIVYKARQIGLNRLVALKMILSGVDAGPRELARFRAEAEAAARVQHSGIVQVYEIGEHDGHPFLVFEYLAGGNLEQRLDGKPWPAAVAARLVESLTLAVQHAHDHGIIHRDLKPANILLTGVMSQELGGTTGDRLSPDARLLTPKVSDFGLARQFDAEQATPRPGLTVTGTIVGTPAYMAPEQTVTRSPVGPLADVYSLGAILYELMTGRPPFQGVDVLDTLDQVRSRDPVPPGQLANVPRDLETICLKCLRKEPHQRYSSAAELGADLNRFLRGEPIKARPTSSRERAWKWAKRRPTVAALLVTLAVLLIAGVSAITLLWRQTAAALVVVRNERNEKEAALASKTIALAHSNWMANDLDTARVHLNECPLAYRDAQWRYLERACNARMSTIPKSSRSDDGTISRIAWSPDGRFLAAIHQLAGVVRVCDAQSAAQMYSLTTGLASMIRQAAFTPDNQIVTVSTPPILPVTHPGSKTASVKIDLNVKRWETTTGHEIARSVVRWPPTMGYLSGDGRQIVGYYGKQLIVTDPLADPVPAPRVMELIQDIPPILPAHVVSHDGRFIVGFKSPQVVTLDMDSAGIAGPAIELRGVTINHVALSPDSRHLAAAYFDLPSNLGFVSIREVRTGREVQKLTGNTLRVDSLGYSPDGARLATASSDKVIILWDAITGREIMTFRGLTAMVTAMAFSADGSRLATAGRDGIIHIWDTRSLEEP